MINFVDDQVARLLQHVRKLGLLQDTFILYTSDHGEMLGDHNLFRKTFAYEGSARIPFMVNAPKWLVNESGTASASVVGLQDVMPTLLDAAGAEIPDTVDGASLLPLMRGEDTAWRDYLHGEHLGTYRPEDAMQYLTDGKEKVHLVHGDGRGAALQPGRRPAGVPQSRPRPQPPGSPTCSGASA